MITDISNYDLQRISRRTKGLKSRSIVKDTPDKNVSENVQDLETYRQYWDSLYDLRKRYRRNCKFNRGDQWSDYTKDDNGHIVREDDYIRSQGKLPLKQNIIRPIAKSLLGLFRSDKGKSIVISRKPNSADIEKMLSNALQYALNLNETREIDPRILDLFLLSGLPVQKIGYDFIPELGRFDIVLEYIDPNYIFFNPDIKDVRLNDLRCIGQIHDISLDELFVNFAKTKQDKDRLLQLYSAVSKDEIIDYYGLSDRRNESLDFYVAQDPSKCRVIEVWEKKAVDVIEYWDPAAGEEGAWEGSLNGLLAINNSRVQKFTEAGWTDEEIAGKLIVYDTSVSFKWFYKFLTPYGQVLREGETPYSHGSHPFVMYPYPLINGEVWGPIEDIIDQQKYINRLVTLWDFIMGTSAKNAVVFDEKSVDGKSPEELGATYRQVGGVFVLDLSGGAQPPFELGGKMPNLGITELISLQLKWLNDISGVQPAMQGQSPNAGTPSSRYAQEAVNASNNSRDLLESFGSFRKRRDFKVLKTIIQFYRDKRYLAISGKPGENNMYDPSLLDGLGSEFDLVIGQSTDSPTYKSWVDDILKDFVMNKLIDIETYLENSNLPFAQSVLEDIRNKREQMAQGQIGQQQAMQGINQNFNQQAGVDPGQIAQLSNMIKSNPVA